MIIKKYLTLLLLGFVYINIQANTEDEQDNEIIRIIPSENDDIIRHLPIYRFCDNEVGLFMNSFLSSIADFPIRHDPIILITNTNNASDYYKRYYNIKLPEDCVLLHLTDWDPSILKGARGAIPLPNNRFGIILSESTEWLEQLNIKETNNILSIYYGKSYLDKDDNVIIMRMTTSYDIWAVLKILDDNKVDPLMIYNIKDPIQNFADLNSKFDWIEEFYKKHGLPAGCGYYEQEALHQYDKSTKTQKDVKISLPDRL